MRFTFRYLKRMRPYYARTRRAPARRTAVRLELFARSLPARATTFRTVGYPTDHYAIPRVQWCRLRLAPTYTHGLPSTECLHSARSARDGAPHGESPCLPSLRELSDR